MSPFFPNKSAVPPIVAASDLRLRTGILDGGDVSLAIISICVMRIIVAAQGDLTVDVVGGGETLFGPQSIFSCAVSRVFLPKEFHSRCSPISPSLVTSAAHAAS